MKNDDLKYSVALDLLQVVYELPDDYIMNFPSSKGGYTVDRITNKIRNFNNAYVIYNHNIIKVAEVYTSPNKGFYKKNEILLKVDNQLLYHEDFYKIIKQLEEKYNLSFVRINAIHIAIDSPINKKAYTLLTKISRNHKSVVINNNNLKLSSNNLNYDNGTYATFHLGSSKSILTASFYNKSLELKKSSKHYIVNFWKKNGLNLSEDIYRIEFKFKYKRIKDFNLDILKIKDIKNLNIILINEIKNKKWLTFYKVKAQDNKRGVKKETLIRNGSEYRWMHWNNLPVNNKLLPKNNTNITPDIINQIKTTITTLLKFIKKNPFIPNNEKIATIEELAKKNGLEEYTITKIYHYFPYNNKLKDLYFDIYNLKDELEYYS
jgi:hypothetical protein